MPPEEQAKRASQKLSECMVTTAHRTDHDMCEITEKINIKTRDFSENNQFLIRLFKFRHCKPKRVKQAHPVGHYMGSSIKRIGARCKTYALSQNTPQCFYCSSSTLANYPLVLLTRMTLNINKTCTR